MINTNVYVSMDTGYHTELLKQLQLYKPVNAETLLEGISIFLYKIYVGRKVDKSIIPGMWNSIQELVTHQTAIRGQYEEELFNFLKQNIIIDSEYSSFRISSFESHSYMVSAVDLILHNFPCPKCETIIPGKEWHSDEDCNMTLIKYIYLS